MVRIIKKMWGGQLKKRAKARFFSCGLQYIYKNNFLHIFIETLTKKCYNRQNTTLLYIMQYRRDIYNMTRKWR